VIRELEGSDHGLVKVTYYTDICQEELRSTTKNLSQIAYVLTMSEPGNFRIRCRVAAQSTAAYGMISKPVLTEGLIQCRVCYECDEGQ
jgi:hypothetical protein